MYIRTYIHTYLYTVHTYINTCIHTPTYTYMYIHIHTCLTYICIGGDIVCEPVLSMYDDNLYVSRPRKRLQVLLDT